MTPECLLNVCGRGRAEGLEGGKEGEREWGGREREWGEGGMERGRAGGGEIVNICVYRYIYVCTPMFVCSLLCVCFYLYMCKCFRLEGI